MELSCAGVLAGEAAVLKRAQVRQWQREGKAALRRAARSVGTFCPCRRRRTNVCGQLAKCCMGLSPSWLWLCLGTDLTAFTCPGLVAF